MRNRKKKYKQYIWKEDRAVTKSPRLVVLVFFRIVRLGSCVLLSFPFFLCFYPFVRKYINSPGTKKKRCPRREKWLSECLKLLSDTPPCSSATAFCLLRLIEESRKEPEELQEEPLKGTPKAKQVNRIPVRRQKADRWKGTGHCTLRGPSFGNSVRHYL